MSQPSPAFVASACILASIGCSERAARPTVAAALIPDPTAMAMPPAGSYRLRWVADHRHPITAIVPGIRLGSGQRPRRAWVQVDYTGPKETIEIVAVNTIDGQVSAPQVIYREKYGAADLEISGSHARYFDNEPFTRPRQTFVLDVSSLQGAGNNTALATIYTFDSVERGFHEASQTQFYMATSDPDRRTGSVSFGEGPRGVTGDSDVYPGPSRPIADDQATTLLWVEREATVSELQLRFD